MIQMKITHQKIMTLLIMVFLVINFDAIAQNKYLSFTDGVKESVNEKTLPKRETKNLKEKGYEVSFQFLGANISDKKVKSTNYNYLHIDGFSKMGQVGAPALPAKNEVIAIPRGAKGNIVILEAEYKEYDGYMIHPTLEPARDTEGAPAPKFEKDEKIYSANEFFPKNVVEITNTGISRGTQLVYVEVRPVQFNPVTGKIRVYSNIKYKLVKQGGENNFDYIRKENSSRYIKMLKRRVINSDDIPLKKKINKSEEIDAVGSNDYIIITHSEYITAANNLANWKRQLGYKVEVVSASSWTAAEVKTAINDRYTAWTPKPDYFVIIGDHTGSYAVPGEIKTDPSYGDDFATDLYFACMDGVSDWHPDMAKGRISVSSADEATVVVNKIINYEKTPVNDADFYQNALNCAQFQDIADASDPTEVPDGIAARRFCHTSEDIRDYLISQSYTSTRVYYTDNANTPTNFNNGTYSNGQAIPTELLKSNGFDWTGGHSEITTEIDEGKFLVFHRDHGYSGGSGWAHPYYTTSTMDNLNNGNLLPVVFSINCHTGEYQLSNCFAEKFLRMENKGAVGVVAAAYYSLSGYNDAVAIGMIDAIWPDPGLYPVMGTAGTGSNYTIGGAGNEIYTMGDIVDQGLYAMEQNVSWSSRRQYEYELFMYFGDPAMRIHTANPNDNIITATHNSSLDCGSTSFAISGSEADAVATLVLNNELISKTTLDGSGAGTLNYTLSIAGDITLTISKHNAKPYIATITQAGSCNYPPVVIASDASVTDVTVALKGEVTNEGSSTVSESGFVCAVTENPEVGGTGVTLVTTDPLVNIGIFNVSVSGLIGETKYYARAYAKNSYGISYSSDLSFTTGIDATNVENHQYLHQYQNDIKIYPNPTNGLINIEIDMKNINANVIITDANGKQVYLDKINTNKKTIDLRNQTKGIYFIKIKFDEKTINSRIILN